MTASAERTQPSPKLVGRDREIASLTRALDGASAGRFGLVLLAGEPGIGKSSLAEEAGGLAAGRGFEVLWGACWEGDGAPALWPWVQIIRAHTRLRSQSDLLAEMGDAAPLVAQLDPEIKNRFLALPPLQEESDPEQARFRLFDGVATLLRNASAAGPLLLVLDDLHWADSASLLLLRFLVRALRDRPILILGTYRDAEAPRDDAAKEGPFDLAGDSISLAGLAPDDVGRLIAMTTGTEAPSEVIGAVHGRTIGNPFFVKEVARLLEAQGRLGDTGGTRLAIPEGVREVVGRRLARLSEACVNVLSAAAVLGTEFRFDVLEQVAGVAPGQLLSLLDEAVSARVVGEYGDSPGRYGFSHALVRDVLVESLPGTKRAALHKSAGETLESLYEGATEPHLAELAHHFIRAIPASEPAKAATYAGRAGARALSMYAYDEAANHYRRAIDVLSGSESEHRMRLSLNLADALTRGGDLPEARRVYEAAANLARKTGDAEALAHAALGLGTGLGGFEVRLYDDVQIALLREALDLLGNADSPLRAWLLARLSVASTYVEPEVTRASLSREAVEMASRTGDLTGQAYALSSLCDALAGPDYIDERIAAATKIVRLAEDIRSAAGGNSCGVPSCSVCLCDPEMSLLGRRFLIVAHLERGEMGIVDSEIEMYARTAEHLRQPLYQWYVPLWRAMRAALAGRLDESAALTDEADRIGERSHSDNAFLLVETQRTAMARLRDELGYLVKSWEVFGERFPGLITTPQALAMKLWVGIADGNTESARALLKRLVDKDFAGLPRDSEFLSTASLAAEACWILEDSACAEVLQEMLRPYSDVLVVDGIGASVLGSVSYFLALLATLVNKFDEAEPLFEKALQAHVAIGALPLIARTQREYARMLMRSGKGERRASRLAHTAAETFNELGLRRAAEATLSYVGIAAKFPKINGVFKREGEFWTVGLEDAVARLKHSKGLRDIATLLSSPNVEVHASELVAADAPRRRAVAGTAEGLGLGGGDTGPILDERARAEYRARLRELEDELHEAEDNNDPGRVARARESIDFIAGELSAAFGLGGKPRRSGDPNERARKAVTERIRETLERIEKASPALGRHLRRSVRTGTFCSYVPDEIVAWSL